MEGSRVPELRFVYHEYYVWYTKILYQHSSNVLLHLKKAGMSLKPHLDEVKAISKTLLRTIITIDLAGSGLL